MNDECRRDICTSAVALIMVAALSGCGASQGEAPAGGSGQPGSGAGSGMNPGQGSAPPSIDLQLPDRLEGGANQGSNGGSAVPEGQCGVLMAVIRDFKDTHPDFEKFLGALDGMVADRLDANRLPVYAFDHPTIIFSKDSFSEWYRDVPSVNMRVNAPLELKEESPGRFVFDSDRFFPVDDKGFGNQGRAHNFHFTTEIRARFTYQGGEVFTYKGDDDVYVFVNGRLALDLGGVHFIMSETIDFDAMATALGIVKGGTYDLDVFHAERHTNDSNFRVETSIQCLVTNPVL